MKCTKSVFLVNNNNDFKFASPEEPKGMRSRTEILGEALCILMVKTQPCAGSLQKYIYFLFDLRYSKIKKNVLLLLAYYIM